MQQNAMATDVGWSRPARRYAALYRELAALARYERSATIPDTGALELISAERKQPKPSLRAEGEAIQARRRTAAWIASSLRFSQ
jgi:hypothetical protein